MADKRFVMKKFHFAPIHFVMLGVISFGILAVLLRAFGEGTLVLLFGFPSNLSTKVF